MRKPWKDLQTINKNSKIYPICIPSYNRPDARLLKELEKDKDLSKCVILFVRKEQAELYAMYKGVFKTVYLKGVHNLGETRAAIMNYAISKGLRYIYMLDDDISQIQYLIPHTTKSGNKCLKMHLSGKKPACGIEKDALILWQKYMHMSKAACSSVVHRTMSWMYDHTKEPWIYNNYKVYCCMLFDVNQFKEKSLNFVSSDICFNEDICMQFQGMEKGLNFIVFKEIAFSNPEVGSQSGGCGEMYTENLLAGWDKGSLKFLENIAKGIQGVQEKKNKKGRYIVRLDWKYWKRPFKESGE